MGTSMDRASFLKSLAALVAIPFMPKLPVLEPAVEEFVPLATTISANTLWHAKESFFVPDIWAHQLKTQLMMNSVMKNLVDKTYSDFVANSERSDSVRIMKGQA